MTRIKKENEIDYFPELPIEIKEAINKRRLIMFVGAGASNQIELPLWKDLADASIKKCFDEGYICDGDRELIINNIKDNKEKLSIAFELTKIHCMTILTKSLMVKNTTKKKPLFILFAILLKRKFYQLMQI